MAQYTGDSANSLVTGALITQRFAGRPRTDAGVPIPEPLDAAALHGPWSDLADGLPDAQAEAVARARFLACEFRPRRHVAAAALLQAMDLDLADGALRHRASGKVVVRLVRPPHALFAAQMHAVLQLAAERAERSAEILTQVGAPDALWASVAGLQPGRHRWTGEFLSVALDAALFVIFGLKQTFACPRPVEFSPQIEPLIQTPGHDTWPSGHSTESHLIASVLGALVTGSSASPASAQRLRARLFAAARRVAQNREVAGLHFPADSAAGCVLGDALGRYIVALARGDAEGPKGAEFNAPAFYLQDVLRPIRDEVELDPHRQGDRVWSAATPVPPARQYLRWLWSLAQAEWA